MCDPERDFPPYDDLPRLLAEGQAKEMTAPHPAPDALLREALDEGIALTVGRGNGTCTRERSVEEWQRLYALFTEARKALAATPPASACDCIADDHRCIDHVDTPPASAPPGYTIAHAPYPPETATPPASAEQTFRREYLNDFVPEPPASAALKDGGDCDLSTGTHAPGCKYYQATTPPASAELLLQGVSQATKEAWAEGEYQAARGYRPWEGTPPASAEREHRDHLARRNEARDAVVEAAKAWLASLQELGVCPICNGTGLPYGDRTGAVNLWQAVDALRAAENRS